MFELQRKGLGLGNKQGKTIVGYFVLATALDNFTYWECEGGRGKESAQKIFCDFFYLVTQVTQETFTDDPSKLPL